MQDLILHKVLSYHVILFFIRDSLHRSFSSIELHEQINIVLFSHKIIMFDVTKSTNTWVFLLAAYDPVLDSLR